MIEGACHCGAVRFEASVDLSKVVECNCSHCEKKGFLLTFTEGKNFRLVSGEDALREYRFNKKRISHQFCTVCGVQPFARDGDPAPCMRHLVRVGCDPGAKQLRRPRAARTDARCPGGARGRRLGGRARPDAAIRLSIAPWERVDHRSLRPSGSPGTAPRARPATRQAQPRSRRTR